MTINLLFEVGHATVADLECVTVEDFVQHMTFRKLLVDDLQERSSNVGSHVLAEGGLYQRMFLRWFLLVVFEGRDNLGVNVRR